MDNLTKEQRRRTMQSIRSKNSQAELLLAKLLRRNKIKFRRHLTSLPGRPDFVFSDSKTIVFVDSDFWHFNSRRFVAPKSNVGYWRKKILFNRLHDKKINATLRKMGWFVIRLWEYDIKHDLNRQIDKIKRKTGLSRLVLSH
ncbi:MAG: very short patch repair endonuclease [Candidatus Saganbacteria bacterium]|nr:very short patch repair endonuclease [Candidatus Saganbacteria bacterium]